MNDQSAGPAGRGGDGRRSDAGSLVRPFLTQGAGPEAGRDSSRPPAAGADAEHAAVAGGTSIRPFLVTSGRTTGATDIAVEAQVMITPRGQTSVENLSFEYRDIVTMCAEPLAVAELAARLSLHLGVIRVLVGDLQHQGMVTTYAPEADATDDVEMIVRVINVLRTRT